MPGALKNCNLMAQLSGYGTLYKVKTITMDVSSGEFLLCYISIYKYI